MSSAGNFPLLFPPEAKSPFIDGSAARQLLRIARLASGARVLEVGAAGSRVGFALAEQAECIVTLAESDAAGVAALEAAIAASKLEGLSATRVDPLAPQLPPDAFDVILLQPRGLMPLASALEVYRPILRRSGRLVFTWPTRVGRFPGAPSLSWWEQRLGEALPVSRDLLLQVGAAGYEPEAAETLGDAEMDELYRSLEEQLSALSEEERALLREEISIHRAQNGKAGVAFTRVIARRREAGEKPPTTRDRG